MLARKICLIECILTTVVACSAFFAFGTAFYGSSDQFLTLISGQNLAIRIDRICRAIGPDPDIGPTSAMFVVIALTNVTPTEIRILGSQTTCSCTRVTDLPEVLRPFEQRLIGVIIDTDAKISRVGVRFITSISTEQPEVVVSVSPEVGVAWDQRQAESTRTA